MKKISVQPNYEKMSCEAAKMIRSVIEQNKNAVIVIATGHSPKLAYRLFVKSLQDRPLDLSGITLVKLDEWCGASGENEASCEYFIRKELMEPLKLEERQYIHFNGEAQDLTKECERVEEAYQQLEKIDLVILGIGMNGHLGLNEPDSKLLGNAHCISLSEKTKSHELLTHTEKTINSGMTLGMSDLFRGEKVLLLADGDEKEAGLSYFLNDIITTEYPVSLLKLHPHCYCIINKESFPKLEL